MGKNHPGPGSCRPVLREAVVRSPRSPTRQDARVTTSAAGHLNVSPESLAVPSSRLGPSRCAPPTRHVGPRVERRADRPASKAPPGRLQTSPPPGAGSTTASRAHSRGGGGVADEARTESKTAAVGADADGENGWTRLASRGRVADDRVVVSTFDRSRGCHQVRGVLRRRSDGRRACVSIRFPLPGGSDRGHAADARVTAPFSGRGSRLTIVIVEAARRQSETDDSNRRLRRPRIDPAEAADAKEGCDFRIRGRGAT